MAVAERVYNPDALEALARNLFTVIANFYDSKDSLAIKDLVPAREFLGSRAKKLLLLKKETIDELVTGGKVEKVSLPIDLEQVRKDSGWYIVPFESNEE